MWHFGPCRLKTFNSAANGFSWNWLMALNPICQFFPLFSKFNLNITVNYDPSHDNNCDYCWSLYLILIRCLNEWNVIFSWVTWTIIIYKAYRHFFLFNSFIHSFIHWHIFYCSICTDTKGFLDSCFTGIMYVSKCVIRIWNGQFCGGSYH